MFRPTSPFNAGTAKSLYAAGLAAIRAGQTSVDLAGLDLADSSAVAALIGWQRAAGRQGSTLTFTNMPANLHSLVTLYGVADLLLAAPVAVPAATNPAQRTDLPHH
ncbi:STAS domain-containing protein [Janthinobacterium sp. 17J80-10]|uniref:STAS domain-containing protein n=1 Tax=Janthinobacterium sp. 17J80-10 TaxID=2497863 RepID=UPI001005808C|nr:STAS domain-containing protein [Janthinobacterium sp. 17J80-10]QAU35833.1 STAS domain-containing protein [Janthinobacterium sp. 17J80-10]